MNKICKQCKIEKSLDDFYKHKKMSDGHLNVCKSCKLDYQKSRPKRDPQYIKDYYQINRERLLNQNREYRAANKEKCNSKSREWKRNNKERVRFHNRKRREMKRGMSDYMFALEHQETVYIRFGHRCFNCGCTENLAFDHHIPASKGGPLSLDNVVLLCGSCNSEKHDKDPEDFYSQEQLLQLKEIMI